MNVLITGGTGFIGSRLALRCLERGDQVAVMSPANNEGERRNRDMLLQHGVVVHEASILDRDSVQRAVSGQEAVVHLAAAQHEANVSDQHFWDINVGGTRNLLQAASTSGVRRFVYGSTIGVYASSAGRALDESSPLAPENVYEETKAAGEEAVRDHSDALQSTILRISETYGPGDLRLLKLFRAIKGGHFFVIGSGKNSHHPIYIDDVMEAIVRSIESDAAVGETFVLAGPEVLTTSEMASAIAQVLSVKEPSLKLPLFPFMWMAVVLQKALGPLGVQPPLHPRRMDFFRKGYEFSIEKMERVLQFKPSTSFLDGARRTSQWYVNEGFL